MEILTKEAIKVMSQLKELKLFAKTVYKQCVDNVSPKYLVQQELKVLDDQLKIRNEVIHLQNNLYLVGFGKAVLEMARVTETLLGSHLQKGIISIPKGTIEPNKPLSSVISVYQGAHNNLPDVKSELNAKRIVELVSPLTANDVLIVLISGGGSALLPYPIPPLTLEDKRHLTELLAQKGADIVELNTVRKNLSLVKGGKLARLAFPSKVVSLVISDVIDDPLDFIAGGPTVPNNSPPSTALEILSKYKLLGEVPPSVLQVLNKTVPQESVGNFDLVSNYIIGNNLIALKAGQNLVEAGGDKCYIMSSSVQGLVTHVSVAFAQMATLICKMLARTINKTAFLEEVVKLKKTLNMKDEAIQYLEENLSAESIDKVVLLFGGETTVQVTGKGKGGRNQELALRFSVAMDEISAQEPVNKLFNVLLLSCGTDGIDGPTDAAGALGYIGLTTIAKETNMDPSEFINNNDAYNFYSQLNSEDDLIKIGHTGTNVMDVMILTIQAKA